MVTIFFITLTTIERSVVNEQLTHISPPVNKSRYWKARSTEQTKVLY